VRGRRVRGRRVRGRRVRGRRVRGRGVAARPRRAPVDHCTRCGAGLAPTAVPSTLLHACQVGRAVPIGHALVFGCCRLRRFFFFSSGQSRAPRGSTRGTHAVEKIWLVGQAHRPWGTQRQRSCGRKEVDTPGKGKKGKSVAAAAGRRDRRRASSRAHDPWGPGGRPRCKGAAGASRWQWAPAPTSTRPAHRPPPPWPAASLACGTSSQIAASRAGARGRRHP